MFNNQELTQHNIQRALFIDDDVNLLTSTKRVLRGMNYAGWEVSFHENPLAAEAIVSNVETDLMVTDMQMPGIDGSHLIYRLRDAEFFPIVFILTGQADESSLARSFGYAHKVIRKPCPVENLRAICENTKNACEIIANRKERSIILKRLVQFLRRGIPEPFLDALRRYDYDLATSIALHDRRAHLFTRYISSYFGVIQSENSTIQSLISSLSKEIIDQVVSAVISECKLIEHLPPEEVEQNFSDPLFPFLPPALPVDHDRIRRFLLSIWNQ